MAVPTATDDQLPASSDLTFSAEDNPGQTVPKIAGTPAPLTFSPEDNANQTVFDNSRQQAYEVPPGLSGRAIDQQIGVTQEKRNKADYFGLVDLGKGFAQNVLQSIPETLAQSLIESGEIAKESSGWLGNIGKIFPIARNLMKDVSDPVVTGPIETGIRLGFNISQLDSENPRSLADFQVETGRRMSGTVKDFIDENGFAPTNPDSKFSKLMFDIGSGASSVATSIGLLYATKNPALIAVVFGAQQKANIYDEARKKGLPPIVSSGISSVAGGIEGGIEAIGAFAFLGAATLNNTFKVIFARSAEQALEEMAQQAGEEIITNITDIRDESLIESAAKVGYAGLLGMILGLPAGAISTVSEKMGITEELRSKGLSEKAIQELLTTASSKTLESGEFQKEVHRVLKDELSEESFTQAERLNGLREVNKIYDEIEANLRVEFAKELGADELKTKLSEEMSRADASIQSKIDAVVEQVQDKQLKGRANELVKNSENVLKELDALEAQKAKLEMDGKATAALDKKIDSLIKKHDQVDIELSDLLGGESGLADKLAKRRAGIRSDLLVRRAEAIVKEIDTLENAKKVVSEVEKQTNVKTQKTAEQMEARLQELAKQYDEIDEELAGLLLDRDVNTIKPSDLLSLKNQDMKTITNKLGKTMEAVRERLQKAMDSIEAKVDKAFQKLANRVATIARQNEKKRIHEALSLLKKIRSADIENITIKERREIQKLQAELKDLKGSPTIDQLRDFNERIQLIKEEGKRKLGEIMDQRRQRREAQKELLLAALDVSPTNEPYVTSQRGKEPLKEKARLAAMTERAVTLAPIRLMEMIDGVENGIWKQLFIDQVNRVVDSKLVKTQEGNARGVEILKSNGITIEELGSKIEVPGFSKSFTVSEVMHFYAAMGNDLNLLALIFDNGIPLQVLESAVASLPTKYKNAADEMVAEMSRHAPRLNIAVLNYTDGKEDLPLVTGTRVPMNRDMDPTEAAGSPQEEIMESLELPADYKQKYAWQGLRRERIKRGENVRLKPIRTGLVEIYFKEVENREHFIAAARAVKDLNSLLADKEISAALVDKFGPAVKNTVQDYVNRVANSTLARGYKAHNAVIRVIDRFARSSRQAAAFVHLGYNLVSVLKVPVSITAALGRVNPLSMLYGIHQAKFNWKQVSEFAYAQDPQLAEAEVSREQQEFKTPLKALDSKSIPGRIPRHAFDMMRAVDQFTRVALWTGAYEQAKDMKMSEADAVKFAQETVLRTQPATNAKDLAGLFATNNEVLNMFLQFTHQLNQNYGILTHDLPRAWKGGRQQAAVAMGFGLVLQALLEYALGAGHMPTEPEELTEAMIQGALMMVPGIGPMLNAIHNGFSTLPPALDLTVKKPWQSLSAAAEGDFEKTLDNAFYFGSAFGKLPYTQVRRTLTGVYELATGETDDYRRLVWSNYQLNREE